MTHLAAHHSRAVGEHQYANEGIRIAVEADVRVFSLSVISGSHSFEPFELFPCVDTLLNRRDDRSLPQAVFALLTELVIDMAEFEVHSVVARSSP